MVTISMVMLTFNLYSITELYFSYSVDVIIKLNHETELVFPAVTFCNMNPVKRSALENMNNFLQNDNFRRTSGTVQRHKRGSLPNTCFIVLDFIFVVSDIEMLFQYQDKKTPRKVAVKLT